MFGNRMITSAIPERVYALCKEVSVKPINEVILKMQLEPEQLGGKTNYFGSVRAAAEQLQLISVKENEIFLAVDKNVIKSMDCFRQYINANLELLSDSLFYTVTKAYLDMDVNVLQYQSVSKMSDDMAKFIGEKVIEDDMRAWRFWVSFLGFGYMHDMQMLPNVAVFLRDTIKELKLKKKTEYTIDEFVKIITPYCGITLNNVMDTKTFNYAFSNALRTLHDLGDIKMIHKLDSLEIWSLHQFEGHEIEQTVTHISIGG